MKAERVLRRINSWKDKDVEVFWDSVSAIYIEENNKVKDTHDQRFTETIKYLELIPEASVLNISSRDCEANDYIIKSESSAKVINAEISKGLMNEAVRVRPYVNQKKISTYSSLPFNNNDFDRVVCLETLEHVENPLAFLKELNRVSTPEAIMVLSCPPATSEIPYRIYTYFFGGHGEGPHRFLSSKEVKILLQHTGWVLIKHKGTILIPAGPSFLQNFGEYLINKFQNTFISELGIRQFYVCKKA
jgi:SAM-dependent methyltransferase